MEKDRNRVMLCLDQTRHKASRIILEKYKTRQCCKHKKQKVLLSWRAAGEGRGDVPRLPVPLPAPLPAPLPVAAGLVSGMWALPCPPNEGAD